MLALTLDTAKNIAIGIVVALVVISLITAKLVASATKKAITLVIFAAIALGVWTQRQSLQRCADKVRAGTSEATCRFFGADITISSPLPDVPTNG